MKEMTQLVYAVCPSTMWNVSDFQMWMLPLYKSAAFFIILLKYTYK